MNIKTNIANNNNANGPSTKVSPIANIMRISYTIEIAKSSTILQYC